MSIDALNYVTTLKVGNTSRKYILSRLADRADERYSCYPSVGLLAAEVEISERQVQKHLAALREAGFISDKERRRQNKSQATSRYFVHGPWDDFGGTGKPFPIIKTPKQARSEMWEEPPGEGEFREGTSASKAIQGNPINDAGHRGVNQETPGRSEDTADQDLIKTAGHMGVNSTTPPPVNSTTPPPVNSTTPPPVNSTTPLEPTTPTTTFEPSLPPSGPPPQPDAEPEGRGGEGVAVGVESGGQVRVSAPVVRASDEARTLLVDLRREDHRLKVTGRALHTYGILVDGLLAGGWDAGDITAQVTANLPERIDKPGGFVRSRLLAMPTEPVALPAQRRHDAHEPTAVGAASAADRTVAEAKAPPELNPNCEGNEANGHFCPDGRLAIRGHRQCGACAGWDTCPGCAGRWVRPGQRLCGECAGAESGYQGHERDWIAAGGAVDAGGPSPF